MSIVSFLSNFEKKGKAGNILEISKIHAAYQKKVDKKTKLSTTYRLLHRHGWRKVAPRPKHPKNDEKAMAGFKKGLSKIIVKAKKKAIELGLSFRLMFQDEARFGRINNPRKCWAPRGYRPEVGKQIVREYTYAYGAVSPFDGNSDFLVLPSMTAKVMNIFLEEIAKRHENEFILMICDQASSHKESVLNIPQNMMIEPLPPYCPQINPAENIWEEMREKFFPNLTFDSMDEVENKLVEGILHLENNPQIVQSITGFDWIINTS